MSGVRIRAGLRPSEFRPRVPEVRPHLARKGETVNVYRATFSDEEQKEKTIPVAAQSLQHAARKASAQGDNHGELIKLELTKDVII